MKKAPDPRRGFCFFTSEQEQPDPWQAEKNAGFQAHAPAGSPGSMTYRKLFHWVLAGSTLATGALWSWSCWGCAELRASHPARMGSYQAGLWSGTVILELHSPEVRPTKAAADAVPLLQQFFLPGLRAHDWSYRWNSSSDLSTRHYSYRRTGELGVEKTFYSIVMGHGFPPHYNLAYRVDFPLWLPWLMIVGGALALTRWLERRAAKA